MAKLTAVDYDPFAEENKTGAKLTPVDFDPFAEEAKSDEPGFVGKAIDSVASLFKDESPSSVMDGAPQEGDRLAAVRAGINVGQDGRVSTVSGRAMDIAVQRSIAPRSEQPVDTMAATSRFIQGSGSPRIDDQAAVTRKPEVAMADAIEASTRYVEIDNARAEQERIDAENNRIASLRVLAGSDTPEGENARRILNEEGASVVLATEQRNYANANPVIADTATDFRSGVAKVPGAFTGLLDIAPALIVGGRPADMLFDEVGKATGFQPAVYAQQLEKGYSDLRKQGQSDINAVWDDETKTWWDVAKEYAANPGVTAGNIIQSLPSMAAGGAIGRATMLSKAGLSPVAMQQAATTAGAIGEGAIMAGQQMDGIDRSVDARTAALASLATGIMGAAVGKYSGALASKFGIRDVDTMLAGGVAGSVTSPFYKRIPAAMVQEGVIEEGTQSSMEQMLKNIAEDKPIMEGVNRAAVEGIMAGSVMGGTVAMPGIYAPEAKPAVDPAAPTLTRAAQVAQAGIAPSMVPAGAASAAELLGITEAVEPTAPTLTRAAAAAGITPLAQPTGTAATSPVQNVAPPIQASETGFPEAFATLSGGGTTEQLYSSAFDALVSGKDTIHGVKDPIITRAKPLFDAGLIKSPGDIRAFEQGGYPDQTAAQPIQAEDTNGTTAAPATTGLDTAGSADGTGSADSGVYGSGAGGLSDVGNPGAAVLDDGQGAALPNGVRDDAVADQIKPIVEQLIKMRKNAGQVRLAPQLDIAVNKAKAAIKSGTGKAADFTKLAKVFKNKDAEIHAALLSIADTLKPAQAPKKAQKASSDLMMRIRQLGGIDAAQALDITGEQKAPGGWRFTFKKGGNSLDDLATMLADEGFQINTGDVDGGVQQLRDMIRTHIGGERNFKAATIEAQAEAVAKSRDLDAMAQRAEELGIGWKNLTDEQLDDAIYLAEDDLRMAAIAEQEVMSDASAEVLGEIAAIDDAEIDIQFGDEISVDPASIDAYFGYEGENGESTEGNDRQAEGATGNGESQGSARSADATGTAQGGEGFALEQQTPADLAQREAQASAEAQRQADEEAQAKKAQDERDQADIDARTSARNANPDNFQFGENSKQAAAPVADLFNQPVVKQSLTTQSETSIEQVGNVKQAAPANEYAGKWFGARAKADEFIAKKNIGATHEVVNAGRSRFEIKLKTPADMLYANSIQANESKAELLTELRAKLSDLSSRALDAGDGKLSGQIGGFTVGMRDTDANLTREWVDEVVAAREKMVAKLEKQRDTAKSDQFANNKVFTADKVAEARARMKKKLGTLNSGFDPELMNDGITIAGAYIESGARSFAAYSKAMVEDFGDAIKPYLRSFYEGVRHYPGIDNSGMTSPAVLDAQEVEAKQPQETASPAIGSIEPRAARSGIKSMVGARLKDDYGVTQIDGYDNETGEGAFGAIKREFLKDGKKYLEAVAAELAQRGFAPFTDRKGKPGKPVSVNESGIATSGDITMTMLHESGKGIYITIGGSSLRGVVQTTKSGVSVMMRVNSKGDQWGGDRNRWMPVNMTASELADAAETAVAQVVGDAQKVADAPKPTGMRVIVNSNSRSFYEGSADFNEGKQRVLPAYYTDKTGKNAKEWYRGWDAANIAAPIENQKEEAQNEIGGGDNARPVQTEGVSGQPAPVDTGSRASGDRAGEPLDAGMAGQGEGADRGGRVPSGVRVSSGTGAEAAGERNGVQPPVEGGTVRNVRADDRAADEVDHTIIDADEIGSGGAAKKFRDNIAAIKILKALDAENRKATPEERKALARYVGFGALKGAFDPDNKAWAKQYTELRELLTDEEFESARASILNAHYTSPVVVKAMYQAVEQLGFKGGRVLEPSVGSGNFFGMMPAGLRNASKLHGVELDLLTSKLASALYPKAHIAVATGFQDYQVPSGYFDMSIGNPPFGSESVPTTERVPYAKFSIHNYFIARMIDKVRDGGIVPVIVSHNFMDAIDPKARAWVAERANLLGAVRLPNTAFKQNAGTEVVTDILFFQKSANPERNPAWVNSSDTEINGERISINDYFQRNKQNILGMETTAGSMYRANEYTVEPRKSGSLEDHLISFVNSLPANVYTPVERTTDELDSADNTIPDGIKQGSYFVAQDGTIKQRGNDIAGSQTSTVWEPKNAMAAARMRGMIELRTTLREQMRLEKLDATPESIERNRAKLNKQYDAFKKEFGFVNSQVNRGLFMDDTEAALLQSIEFDYDKGISKAVAEKNDLEARDPSAKKADILARRVLFPATEKMNVESAKDALLASLDSKGGVDLEYMERAYRKPQSEIIAELGDILFQDPATGDHVMADEYLSGDVKTKLEEAKKAESADHAYARNVKALEEVIPADKLPSEIFASVGAGWIPAEVFVEFGKEITGSTGIDLTYLAATAQWLGDISDGGDIGKMRSDFGTDKITSFDLFKLMLNGKAPELKKRIMRDGKEAYVTDEEATEAAREKTAKIKSLWESWVWQDGARAERLAGIYNEKHNRVISRTFDGSHLALHGSNPNIVLIPSQKNGVWRMVQDRNVLLDHVVGAGKTFAMVAAVMEMKRLGIARKPVIVVPNHLTMQWRSEFARLYPAANVLAATPDDFAKGKRERMFSKIALGDYDAVIIGHSSLTRIGLDAKIEQEMIQEQIDEIANAIEAAKKERGDKRIVSDMEKIKKNLEAKVADLVKKAGERDKVVTFDELGIDAMMIDEMHEFKNLFFVTQKQRVSGLGNPKGSGKAFDLFAKVRWLQKTYGEKAPLITATGTPVSNSLAEMFTMQRYMRFDELKRAGLHLFDSWARMYGEDEYVYEVAPSGVGYRISQRFSKFKNLPALMAHYSSFADTVTLQDLKDQASAAGKRFPVPNIIGSRPQNIVAQRSDTQRNFFGIPKVRRDESGNIVYAMDYAKAKVEQNNDGRWVLSDGHSSSMHDTKEDAELTLVERSLTPILDLDEHSLLGRFANLKELTRKTKGKINALSLTSLASKAGLDMRMIDPSSPDHPGSKINIAVANMLRTYKQWSKDKGTQLVFCDLSIPLSARNASATNEKRLYVLDDNGLLTHKKGTLHTIEGYEGFPFYLVKSGKKETTAFAVYDPVTGARIQGNLPSKAAAKEWAAEFLSKDENRDRWYEARDAREPITKEAIDEYRDENDLEIDEDGSNEIGQDDIEGVSGASGFSVYDDIKAKLIAAGIPENEIAFIHDYNTPNKKQELFKRMNRGDVRFLFGSTPKLGAGTNVQERLVGLHHIDAPWRPSDLEQREGRIIRQGNSLYERDPDGFEVFIGRYATEQTYDTRRWQLLEHKAAGIEQLRKYSGEAEIDDVAGEAANAADMKAAASGNPLILEETKLRTEVKRLTSLQKAHSDSTYALQRKLSHERNRVATFLPQKLEAVKQAITSAKANPARTGNDEIGNIIVDGKNIKSRTAAEEAIATAAQKVRGSLSKQVREIVYRGVLFELDGGGFDAPMTLYTPTGEYGSYSPKENVSASGMLTRFENYIDSLEQRQARFEAEIEQAKKDIASIEERIHAPFSDADALEAAKADHAKVQRRLMKSTQIDAVPQEERADFMREIEQRKAELKKLGYGQALKEMDRDAGDEVMQSASGNAGSQTVESVTQATAKLRASWAGFKRVKIVQTVKDIPNDIYLRALRALKPIGQNTEGVYDPVTKTAYLIAGNIATPERAVWVAAHEVAGHGGIRMLDRGISAALDHAGKNSFVRRLSQAIAADRGQAYSEKTHLDEAVAELAAAYVTGDHNEILERYEVKVPVSMRNNLAGMLKRVADAVRAFVAKMLGKQIDGVSDTDVVAMIREQIRAVSGNDNAGTQDAGGAVMASTAQQSSKQPRILRMAKAASMERDTSLLDKIASAPFKWVRWNRIVEPAFDRLMERAGEFVPEKVKAGMISDYGLGEDYIDRKAEMKASEAAMNRKSAGLVEMLAALTRAESRIAYQWMQTKPDAAIEQAMLEQLPEESRATLKTLKQLISDMGREAVRLGQMSAEAYERNNMAYLHRTYAKHVLDNEGAISKMLRARALRIKGNQYKGRGIFDEVRMDAIGGSADFGRKLQQGAADKSLVGEKVIRFERRDDSADAMDALPGMTKKPMGKLREVIYWPASQPVPAKFGDWVDAGTFEVRGTKGDKLVVWRDYTKDERERMGELDEVRYAVAQTLQMMVHDIEVGRFFEWTAKTYGKAKPEGRDVAASESMLRAYSHDEWVQVPTSNIPSTQTKKYGALAGMYVPGAVWNDIRQTAGTRIAPFGEAHEKLLQFWKKAKTAWSPAVHMNNVMANFVIADWHDLRSADLAEALKVWAYSGKRVSGIKGKIGLDGSEETRRNYEQIWHRFEDSGALGGMFLSNEALRDEIAKQLEAMKEELTGELEANKEMTRMAKVMHLVTMAGMVPVNGAKVYTSKMEDAYQFEDAIFRLAAFTKAIRYGKSDIEAGRIARHSFLNYDINAPWIQAARHTALPFISFFYRALPMAINTAKAKPWKILKLMAFWHLVSTIGYMMSGGDEDDERELLPKEKQGSVWGVVPKMVRMPWNKDGEPVFLDIRRWVPVGDVADMEMGSGMLPPWATPGGVIPLLAEVLLMNKSVFTEKEIVQETDTMGEKLEKRLDHLFKGFMPNVPLPNPLNLQTPSVEINPLGMSQGSGQPYAWSAIEKSMLKREGSIGEVRTTPAALASAVGIKVAAYPASNMEDAIDFKIDKQIREIENVINGIDRNYENLKNPSAKETARYESDIERQYKKIDELELE